MYNNKYLKYKNKFLNLRKQIDDRKIKDFDNSINKNILLGSGKFDLPSYARQEYIDRIEKFYSNQLSKQECQDIIKKNIIDMYFIAIKLLESYNRGEYQYLYNKMKLILDKIMSKDISEPNIAMLNIISLQCVIFFTEILKILYPEKTQMKKYADGRRAREIQDNYASYTRIEWYDYDTIFQFTIKGQYNTLVRKDNGLIECNINKQYVCVILGELSLFEILYSLANNVNLVGITTEMEWADGNYYTPFEFMDHDITHGYNLFFSDHYSTNLYKTFIKYLLDNKDLIDKDELTKILIILFLIKHEDVFPNSESNAILLKPIINTTIAVFSPIILEARYWIDIHFFGGLLPEYIFDNSSKIQEYLFNAFETFKNIWNTFFDNNKEITSEYYRQEQIETELKNETRKKNDEEWRLKAIEADKNEKIKLDYIRNSIQYQRLPKNKQFEIGDKVYIKTYGTKLFKIQKYEIINDTLIFLVEGLVDKIKPIELTSQNDYLQKITDQSNALKAREQQIKAELLTSQSTRETHISEFNIGERVYLTNMKNKDIIGDIVTIDNIIIENGQYIYQVRHYYKGELKIVKLPSNKLTKTNPIKINTYNIEIYK